MKEYKILVVEEDEIRDGVLSRNHPEYWLANHVVVRKNDGTCEIIKDRWDYPGNLGKVEVYLPRGVTRI